MLTLEKAKTLIRQKAAVKDHCHELQLHQMGSEAADLGRLGGHRPIQNRSDNKPQQSFFRKRQKGLQCTRCGHDNYLAGDKCPTTGAICHKCVKKGHFAAYCFTKPLHAVSTGNTEEKDFSFLGTMIEDNKDSWYIDTGAEITAIYGKTHQLIGKPKLANPSKVLYGPVNQTLNVMGQFSGCLKYGKHSSQETAYVVKGLKLTYLV